MSVGSEAEQKVVACVSLGWEGRGVTGSEALRVKILEKGELQRRRG